PRPRPCPSLGSSRRRRSFGLAAPPFQDQSFPTPVAMDPSDLSRPRPSRVGIPGPLVSPPASGPGAAPCARRDEVGTQPTTTRSAFFLPDASRLSNGPPQAPGKIVSSGAPGRDRRLRGPSRGSPPLGPGGTAGRGEGRSDYVLNVEENDGLDLDLIQASG